MRHALAVLLLLSPSAPVVAALEDGIRVGDSGRECAIAAETGAVALRLVVREVEPLTILAESGDADVSLRVEDESGAVLASDADGGIETDAWLAWTPPRPGPFVIRVLADEGTSGTVAVAVLRGALDPAPENPELSARAYWRRALARARERGDGARATLAATRLAGLGVAAGATDSIDEAVLAARASLAESQAALRTGDRNAAREKSARATERLVSLPAGDEDALVADAAREAVVVAESLQDPRSQLAASDLWLRFGEKSLPEEHPLLQDARVAAGTALHRVGQPEKARAILEKAVFVRTKTLPEEHAKLLIARQNYAITLGQTGDLQASRNLFEKILEVRERSLPPDDPLVISARKNYAISIALTGDLEGARVLEERVIAALEKSLAPDDPKLLDALFNHGSTLSRLGRHEAARDIALRLLPIQEKRLPPDDPDLLNLRQNLAGALWNLGRKEEAERLFDAALATLERTHEHSVMLQAQRLNLAALLQDGGKLEAARRLEEKAIESLARTGDPDHPELSRARSFLYLNLRESGLAAQAGPLFDSIISGARLRASRGALASRREACVTARSLSRDVGFLLSCDTSGGGDPARTSAVFALVESGRILGSGDDPARLAIGGDPALERQLAAVGEARRRSAELGARIGAMGNKAPPGAVGALADAASARDRAEQAFRSALSGQGVHPVEFDSGALARALPAGSAAVGYQRFQVPYGFLMPQRDGGTDEGFLIAHVLKRDGSLVRVDLGPADALERLVERWRAAIGCPVGPLGAAAAGDPAAARGIGKTTPSLSGDEIRTAGEALRRGVLDPVLAVAGKDVTTLYVCLDDFLHVTPLDALPLDDGAVGDRCRVQVETSFARLLAPQPASPSGEPSLVTVGGIDYDADGAIAPRQEPALAPPIAIRGPSSSSSSSAAFSPLPGSREEIAAVARVFEERFGVGAHTLDGSRATKAALAAAAPRARVLHIATHGYFAEPEGAAASGGNRGGFQSLTPEETAASLLPLTLCGIALAGANRGVDGQGQVPGILTAEELSSLDLRGCDLAVLSACDTNAGIRRAGEGVHSLRAALHAAGARSSVTSLWPIADEEAKEFMIEFYRRLLVGKKPRSQALWEAKRSLRDRGRRVAAWAGWILTGEEGALAPEAAPRRDAVR